MYTDTCFSIPFAMENVRCSLQYRKLLHIIYGNITQCEPNRVSCETICGTVFAGFHFVVVVCNVLSYVLYLGQRTRPQILPRGTRLDRTSLVHLETFVSNIIKMCFVFSVLLVVVSKL